MDISTLFFILALLGILVAGLGLFYLVDRSSKRE